MSKQIQGILLVLVSAAYYASYGIWSRLMASAFGEFSQAWTRGLMLLIVILFAGKIFRLFKPIAKKDWKWFLTIALAGGINQAPYYLGFEHLPIGAATMLFYGALVVGGYLLGKVFFQEKMGVIKIGSLALGILGMALIYKFSLTWEQLFPAAMTMIAGILGSSTVILPKKLTSSYSEPQIMAGYFTMQVIFNLPISVALHNPIPTLFNHAWLPQIGYAIAMLLANLAAIAGYSKLEPSVGSLVGMVEIIFGFLFGFLLFGEVLTMGVLAGSFLIILAAVLPLISNQLADMK